MFLEILLIVLLYILFFLFINILGEFIFIILYIIILYWDKILFRFLVSNNCNSNSNGEFFYNNILNKFYMGRKKVDVKSQIKGYYYDVEEFLDDWVVNRSTEVNHPIMKDIHKFSNIKSFWVKNRCVYSGINKDRMRKVYVLNWTKSIDRFLVSCLVSALNAKFNILGFYFYSRYINRRTYNHAKYYCLLDQPEYIRTFVVNVRNYRIYKGLFMEGLYNTETEFFRPFTYLFGYKYTKLMKVRDHSKRVIRNMDEFKCIDQIHKRMIISFRYYEFLFNRDYIIYERYNFRNRDRGFINSCRHFDGKLHGDIYPEYYKRDLPRVLELRNEMKSRKK